MLTSGSPGFLRVLDQHDVAVEAFPGVLLEELLARDPVRAAQQRERPADDERPHERPDLGVIVGKAFLGDADVGPVDAIGMGQRDRPALGLRRLFGALGAFGSLGPPPRQASRARPRAAACPRAARRNEAWRRTLSAVQARKSTSATSSGRTKRTCRASSALSRSANGLEAMRIGSSRRIERPRGRRAEARADPPDIAQRVALVDAEHQRADRVGRGGRGNEARHDELLPGRAFRFDPALSAARNDRESRAASRRSPSSPSRQACRSTIAPSSSKWPLSRSAPAPWPISCSSAALRAIERRFPQVVAVEIEEVEGVEEEAVRPSLAEIGLKGGEIRGARCVLDDELAVDHRFADRQGLERRNDLRRRILQSSRARCASSAARGRLDMRLEPIAVELDLVQPARAVRAATSRSVASIGSTKPGTGAFFALSIEAGSTADAAARLGPWRRRFLRLVRRLRCGPVFDDQPGASLRDLVDRASRSQPIPAAPRECRARRPAARIRRRP